jgi:glycosyltransferase involved in cell wall biosynthesis
VNVFLWHVHGSWTTAFVQGRHSYLVPVLPDRGPDGRGRAESWDWPPSVVEVTPEAAARAPVDVVLLQRPHELDGLASQWLGREPGRDVPAVYLEHTAPQGRVNEMRHPAADRPGLTVAHVTHHNRLFWDTGSTPAHVIEHGVIDPGRRYSGCLERAAAAINEPARRGRVVGADLLPELARGMPIDLFGMGTAGDVPQWRLHEEVARRRAYVHPYRWTSLGLSLIEAMHLGMPVVALGTTEVPEAVPATAGFVSNRLDVLREGLRRLAREPGLAREMGEAARAHALERFGLARFLRDWDQLLAEVTA